MMAYMLTTVDNPFNPHTQFDEWRAYDEAQGHYSLALLARVARVSDELSDADYYAAVDVAIEEIIRINASGVHTRVGSDPSSQ